MDTNSEAWRLECEARHVLGLGGLMARRAYLELIEGKRGADARRALEAAIKVEWNKRARSK
ncbi:DUF7696 family protein [Undibacterium macrobrachii]|uniref:Uncharacterized protein n=1 Tax=Undibacterium macrobrachii TaxID=1119058 RepID=A0ABQ2X6G2_9BURK|nr:hypothetical protein [Undibacterium macrobrachii]GGX01516.1 hypothetical protein GCM10011282_04310 [Undibacterium macrobrachii]